MKNILIFVSMLLAALALDMAWIGVVMNRFYLDAFSGFGLISPQGKFAPRLAAAGVVYLLIPVALLVFVVQPSARDSWASTLVRGAALGLCLYGVYDFTNLATIRDWTLKLTVVDVAWGVALCAGVGGLGRWVSEHV